jgi:uncharacterized protein YbaR (Trm112 family)
VSPRRLTPTRQYQSESTMSLDHKLLSILVCPICKGELVYDKDASELVCRVDHLAYPIREDIPVMLSNEARQLTAAEREKYQ